MQGWQAKSVANMLNGSTPLGLGIAKLGRARLAPAPRGMFVATGFGIGFPKAAAFTFGNVVISRHDAAWLDARPRMLRHEERHSWQYVVCLGLPMIPLYLAAAGYSYLRGGGPVVHNVFERLAGLEDGGYSPVSVNGGRPTRTAGEA